jgi:2-hydroxychromene-2-carboxylate isomerase
MSANFAADRDIDNPRTMSEVLEVLQLSATELLAAAQSEDNKRRLWDQTETAHQRGIFGAPTFLVGSEMFWGNDRLEGALSCGACAAVIDHSAHNERPFKPAAGTAASGR